MQELRQILKELTNKNIHLPYSVYSSTKEQRILNAPIIKPLLVFVLAGVKQIGSECEVHCTAGHFLFLSNTSSINMRNIPGDEYVAVLIEFEFTDFDQFSDRVGNQQQYFLGKIDDVLTRYLKQLIHWSSIAPTEVLHFRRKELLQLLYASGYKEVSRLVGHPTLSHHLHELISTNFSKNWNTTCIASQLAVSESTLRRKLKSEGTSIKEIIRKAKLGYGLHLIQTTMEPIGHIAGRCGYSSQSKFTHKFKSLFGVTPTELRKTRYLSSPD